MLYTSARVAGRANAYVLSAFQRSIHLSSRPSSAGLSGTRAPEVVGASVRGSAEVVMIEILKNEYARRSRVSCGGNSGGRSYQGICGFQFGKIAEVAIGCPKLGDAMADADGSDPGVMNLCASHVGVVAQAVEDVHVMLRLGE